MSEGVAQRGLLDYRSLVWNFAQRDLKSRFKGTIVGWGWSLLLPLASLGIYTLISHVIFRASPPDFGNGKAGNFAAYLFVGLTVWGFFANGLNTAIASLVGTGSLLKKIYFPSYAPILGSMVAVGIQSLIELGLVLVVLTLFANIGWTWLLVPFWAVLLLGFVTGVSLMISIANIYFRDLSHIVAVFLQLLFYATPIIYPPTQINAKWHGHSLRSVIMANPMSEFVELFRDITYGLHAGQFGYWLSVTVWSGAVLALGVLVFKRSGRDLGEYL